VQTQRNIGKAYYEQGKYPEAIAAFQKVLASGHAVAMDHLNLGQALMQANRLDEALGELTTAKQMDSKQLATDYNLGILYKRELRYPDAERALKHVVEADSGDPAGWFNLGTVYFAEKKFEEALDAHQHVVQMGYGRGKNFYVASTFHMFTILTRMKRPGEAQKFLKINQELRDKVPGISLQYPALEAGKYGVLTVPSAPVAVPARGTTAEKLTFREITAKLGVTFPALDAVPAAERSRRIKSTGYSLDFARKSLVPLFGTSVAIGDYDGDGRPDLYVVNPAGTNHLYHNNRDGTLTDVTDKAGVAGPGSSLSATFADYDNSGHLSLFVVGLGGVRLFHNDGKGTFSDVTEKAGLKGNASELDTRAVLFDSDNDGFLDLVLTAYTDLGEPPHKDEFAFPDDFAGLTSRLFRNNGDGTFTDATASSGLTAKGRMRKAVFADFNNDGYADLLFVRDDGSPILYINKGENKFVDHTTDAGTALAQSSPVDAAVADFNHDGNFDLVLWLPTGYQVLLNRGDARFETVGHLPAINPPQDIFACRGAVADVNADSFDDLLINADGTWRVIANHAGTFQDVPLELSGHLGKWLASGSSDHGAGRLHRSLASLTPAWFSNPGRMDLAGTVPNGQVVVFEKDGPPAHWVEVRFDGFKSNKQGIGNIVEFKAGNFYTKALATGDPVRVYTGDLTKLDVVRTTWPNQVVQNSIDIATNKPVEVRESERLASSCPFLYVWDGREYVFFTDILGVAPLGELLPDGTRTKPHPEELVRLGSNLPRQGGEYVFQVTDEMREADYFDQLRLLAIDHPADEEVYANEMYSSSPQAPSLYAVHEKRFPVSAVDDHGIDVLPLIQKVDGRYPTGFRQERILGLAERHSLTLDLGEFPQDRPIALWLTGWVFWTDSNASRALTSNSQLQMTPPYLQVRDVQGQWVTAIDDMGLPSGTNRTMRVDLTGKFRGSDHHIRIVTNFCVYWDQIFFTTQETSLAPAKITAFLAAQTTQSAALAPLGWSLPISSAGPRGLSSKSWFPCGFRGLVSGHGFSRAEGEATLTGLLAPEGPALWLKPPLFRFESARLKPCPDTRPRCPAKAMGHAQPSGERVASVASRVRGPSRPSSNQQGAADSRAVRVADVPLVSADVHYRGFSSPASDPRHRKPDTFDYRHVLADAPWNPFTGNYTRYGEVKNLLARTDDRLVVMAAGDEMTARFSARRLPALRPGWKRDFFLYASGYAKDGEPNTAYSRTVGPLPFRAMPNYPYEAGSYPDGPEQRAYLHDYQTRPGHVLIPTLAPALR
jgi:hypothetical protein